MGKSVRYMLEVYEPMSVDSLMTVLEAETPFGAISVGDVLHPSELPNAPQKALRATLVEHVLVDGKDRITHKVMVFTEEIDTIRDLGALKRPKIELD